MANIEEMLKSMTLFYNKESKEVKYAASGIQDMRYFGELEEQYNEEHSFIVLEKEDKVLDNFAAYEIIGDTLRLKEVSDI